MTSIAPPEPLSLSLSRPTTVQSSSAFHHHLPCLLLLHHRHGRASISAASRSFLSSAGLLRSRRPLAISATGTLMADSPTNGVYTVGDFMTKREELHVVKPTTTVDEALESLVENRITGFPVIDEDWKLVGLVSDYDLLALDSISGTRADANMFPEVDSTWKTFNEVQKLLSKTNGKVVGDLMTPAPMVVCETTNLEDVARLLLETKYRRLPVVDDEGKLVRAFHHAAPFKLLNPLSSYHWVDMASKVGIITRGNVVRAALQIKRASETKASYQEFG